MNHTFFLLIFFSIVATIILETQAFLSLELTYNDDYFTFYVNNQPLYSQKTVEKKYLDEEKQKKIAIIEQKKIAAIEQMIKQTEKDTKKVEQDLQKKMLESIAMLPQIQKALALYDKGKRSA